MNRVSTSPTKCKTSSSFKNFNALHRGNVCAYCLAATGSNLDQLSFISKSVLHVDTPILAFQEDIRAWLFFQQYEDNPKNILHGQSSAWNWCQISEHHFLFTVLSCFLVFQVSSLVAAVAPNRFFLKKKL